MSKGTPGLEKKAPDLVSVFLRSEGRKKKSQLLPRGLRGSEPRGLPQHCPRREQVEGRTWSLSIHLSTRLDTHLSSPPPPAPRCPEVRGRAAGRGERLRSHGRGLHARRGAQHGAARNRAGRAPAAGARLWDGALTERGPAPTGLCVSPLSLRGNMLKIPWEIPGITRFLFFFLNHLWTKVCRL